MFKPKIRIQLRDDKGQLVSDRLVDQYTELLNGPKESHKGPVTIEFTAVTEEDIDKIKIYLDQLSGKVTLEKPEKSKRGRKPGSTTTKTTTKPVKEIIQDLKKIGSIEKIITYLEDLNFRFIGHQYLEDLRMDGRIDYDLPDKPCKTYLARRYHTAVDPQKDKYDWKLMVGIDLFDKKNEVNIYIKMKYKGKLKAKWEKLETFQNIKKKKDPMIFPDHLSHEERKKWRIIHQKVKGGRKITMIDEHFYYRYKPEIEKMNSNK